MSTMRGLFSAKAAPIHTHDYTPRDHTDGRNKRIWFNIDEAFEFTFGQLIENSMCGGLTPRLIYNNMYIYSIMHNLIQAASNFDKYE